MSGVRTKASCNANSKLFVSRFCPLNLSFNLVQYGFNFIKISLVELYDKLTYYPLSHKKGDCIFMTSVRVLTLTVFALLKPSFAVLHSCSSFVSLFFICKPFSDSFLRYLQFFCNCSTLLSIDFSSKINLILIQNCFLTGAKCF